MSVIKKKQAAFIKVYKTIQSVNNLLQFDVCEQMIENYTRLELSLGTDPNAALEKQAILKEFFRLKQEEFNYVTNEEADEDYRISMMQDEQRYEDSHKRTSTTQRLLDYVDEKGAVTYGELHKYYKYITGSNSFSHMLKALRTPYKNRLTQRYIVKEGKRYSDAKYIIKLANPSNWVVNEYDNDFKTFNEAPYGND